MTKHEKISAAPRIDRRSFIVGTAATGLVIGYAALVVACREAAKLAFQSRDPKIAASIPASEASGAMRAAQSAFRHTGDRVPQEMILISWGGSAYISLTPSTNAFSLRLREG